MMTINLAVYTAIHGYDWQPGTLYSTSDLVRYKNGIGRLPDPLMESLPFGGVFNDGDTIVFYRYHMAVKSDAKGRDSLYLVLGTLPKAAVRKIDFRSLFSLPEFSRPMKPAPTTAVYNGPSATGTPPNYDEISHGSLSGVEAFTAIGTWFSNLSEGTLKVKIIGTSDNPVMNVHYEKPRYKSPLPDVKQEYGQRPSDCRDSSRDDNCGCLSSPSPFAMQSKPTIQIQSLLLPVLLAFLAGVIVGWFARDAKGLIGDAVKTIREFKAYDRTQGSKGDNVSIDVQ